MNEYADQMMSLAIAFIMFGIGLNLAFKDFLRVFLRPKAILTGLFAQIILLPLIAFLIIYWWPIAPIYKAGFMLIAAAPGGTASNLVTHMLRGRVALSVSLTSFNSFFILLTIPLLVSLSLGIFLGKETEIEIAPADTFQGILLTVVLPVVAGVLVNRYTPKKLTESLRQPLRIILPALLLVVFFIALFMGEANQPAELWLNLELVWPLLLLNGSGMLCGYYFARWLGIYHDGRYTIAVEMGLQNSALAIFIASQVLGSAPMALVAVIYTSFSFISTWLFAWLMKHYLPE